MLVSVSGWSSWKSKTSISGVSWIMEAKPPGGGNYGCTPWITLELWITA
jgi:hypothetical protein